LASHAIDRLWLGLRLTALPNDPQQRIVAHLQHQPLGQTCRWSATKGKPEIVDNAIVTCCPA